MKLLDWLLRRDREGDLDDEIRSHLSMAEQDRMADGEDSRSARLASLKEFGNVTLTREATRLSWGGVWRSRVADVAQDFRYAIRTLGRSPGYSLVVIAVLALGIGANVSVFSLFNALAIKPIPGVEGSAGLGVLVTRTDAGRILPLSHRDFRDLREQGRAFAGLAGTSMDAYSLGLVTHGERVFGEMVTGSYFEVLGVQASLGRTLLPSDDVSPGKHPVVVISDALWRRAFASDPQIVGTTIQVSAYPLTIVGVTKPGFQGSIVSLRMDLYVPVMTQPQLRGFDLLAVPRARPAAWRDRGGVRVGGIGPGDPAACQPALRGEPDRCSLVRWRRGRGPVHRARRVVRPGLARVAHRSNHGASAPLTSATP